jgi:hypothetical protein
MPPKAAAVPADGSTSKGRDISGALTKQTTLDRNPQWKDVIAPQIENPQECVGKTVLVEGSFWENCSQEEEIEEYECKVLRYVCHELEPFYPDRHCHCMIMFSSDIFPSVMDADTSTTGPVRRTRTIPTQSSNLSW